MLLGAGTDWCCVLLCSFFLFFLFFLFFFLLFFLFLFFLFFLFFPDMESASETLVDRARRASVKRSESATHLVANTFSRTPASKGQVTKSASKSGGHGPLRSSTNM